MKEIKIIVNEGRKVKLGDDVISVKEFDLKTLPMVVDYFDGIYELIDKNSLQKGKGSENAIVTEIMKAVVLSLKDKTDVIVKIVAASTSMPVSEIAKLPLDAIVALLREVIEVNYDFLSQRVMPLIKEMFDEIGQKAKKTKK